MPYIYQPLQDKLFVTIAEYNKAFKLIEQKTNFDPRPMLAIIARFMEANSRISGLVRTAHDAVTSFDWNILPANNSNEAAEIAAQMKQRFLRTGVHHYFDVIMDGEFYGLTAIRQQWQSDNSWWSASLSIVPVTRLCKIADADGVFRVALIDDDQRKFSATIIPPEELVQYIISDFNPFRSTRPEYLGGLIRSAIPLTIIKNFSWQDWALFTELFGQPFRVGEYKTGASEEDKAAAKQALEQFGRNAWALVSENIKFQLVEAARAGNVSAYETLMEKIDAELAILINGTASTQELPDRGGSRAAVQTLKLISDDRMWWRMKRLEQIVNEQHIAVDYHLNVNTQDFSMLPRFVFCIDEREDREANARIVSELTNAGYTLDDAEVSQKTGFTVVRTNSLA